MTKSEKGNHLVLFFIYTKLQMCYDIMNKYQLNNSHVIKVYSIHKSFMVLLPRHVEVSSIWRK